MGDLQTRQLLTAGQSNDVPKFKNILFFHVQVLQACEMGKGLPESDFSPLPFDVEDERGQGFQLVQPAYSAAPAVRNLHHLEQNTMGHGCGSSSSSSSSRRSSSSIKTQGRGSETARRLTMQAAVRDGTLVNIAV